MVFSILWEVPSQQMQPGRFAVFSLATILVTTIAASLILIFVSRAAAGSGIPQVKVAYWRDFGVMPAKVIVAKFFAGVLSIGGGCSFGREGPTVHIAGALASNLAGWFGVAKEGRRPAILCGAAAGLAGAFNTPLSAIAFVLEQIREDLNDRSFLAQVLIASATATFVCQAFLGENPAFVIPPLSPMSSIPYLLVIPTAGLAALAGVGFQKGTLAWRAEIKRIKRIPPFLKGPIGALINWVLGIAVFLGIAKIGVFGLGYGDLESMLGGGITGPQATILLIAKLAATTAVYAWGGAGGIFSPTLFFGAAIGVVFSDLCRLVLNLQPSDRIAFRHEREASASDGIAFRAARGPHLPTPFFDFFPGTTMGKGEGRSRRGGPPPARSRSSQWRRGIRSRRSARQDPSASITPTERSVNPNGLAETEAVSRAEMTVRRA